ncbi:MAG: CHAP domain-containing protein [Proteobacteria bacterium]|nr:CHAP domain-containing protein [Pseudomonadota bacterium]
MIYCKRGDLDSQIVREVQEWLCLHGLRLSPDGDFGEITERAVKEFQAGYPGLVAEGIVQEDTLERLRHPLKVADLPLARQTSLGNQVVMRAKQHLKVHPREVGGQNKGPWVRLYCQGHDGTPWAWCAGFVSYIVASACREFGVRNPLKYTMSCDNLADQAQRLGILANGPETGPRPGDIFLNVSPRNKRDWVHTGIVTGVDGGEVRTIEGNTNDDGSREGYEVCTRRRAIAPRDFVLLSKLGGS